MPPETPHPVARPISTGFFHEGPAYTNYRSQGTDDWLLIFTSGGAGRFGYTDPAGSDADLVAREGDIVLIKPGTLHRYGTDAAWGRWDLLWAHFHPRPHWLEWLEWPVVSAGMMHLTPEGDARREFFEQLHECHQLASGARRRNKELAMNALEHALLTADAFNPRSSQAGVADERIREAMDFACRNLSRRLSLDDLAETAGLSLSRFAHLFRQQTGTTPQQFVEAQRIAQAKQLLDLSSRSIKQIARDLGFDTPFYFSQRFRKHVGIGPRDYRNRSRTTAR